MFLATVHTSTLHVEHQKHDDTLRSVSEDNTNIVLGESALRS
jgi:hypothetical protein